MLFLPPFLSRIGAYPIGGHRPADAPTFPGTLLDGFLLSGYLFFFGQVANNVIPFWLDDLGLTRGLRWPLKEIILSPAALMRMHGTTSGKNPVKSCGSEVGKVEILLKGSAARINNAS
jgi:hypothetical protein